MRTSCEPVSDADKALTSLQFLSIFKLSKTAGPFIPESDRQTNVGPLNRLRLVSAAAFFGVS